MSKPYKIYAKILIQALKELSSKAYQETVWINGEAYAGMTRSFIEAANNVLCDTCIDSALANGDIIYDKAVTASLQKLARAIDAVDENQPEEVILADKNMEKLRMHAANTLKLIIAADHSEGTVEIIN